MSETTPAQGLPTATTPQQQQQQQQQQQGVPQQQAQPVPAPSSVAGDQLVCQWSNCGERCPTAEQLYVSDFNSIKFVPHVRRVREARLNATVQEASCWRNPRDAAVIISFTVSVTSHLTVNSREKLNTG